MYNSEIKKITVFGVLLVFAAIFASYAAKNGNEVMTPVKSESTASLVDKIIPTPLPFEDLTIPGLRQRNFDSTLSELESLANNGEFASFLTSYKSDGLNINALLTKPSGAKPENGWPAIVFVHGYIPPAQYKTQQYYVDYVNYLARNGFVVLKIDLRGHGQSEGDAGGGYYSADYVIDTLNAYSALQKTEFVDDSRIGLWGHSMAGNVVLRAIAAKKDIPAAVIWAGAGFTYQDLQDYGITDNSYQPSKSRITNP